MPLLFSMESHRENLLPRLQDYGLEISEAIQQGRYIAHDAAQTICTFIIDGMVDSRRFLDGFGNLIQNATKAARRKYPCVVVFGEGADLLVAEGNVDAAIQDERLCNRLTKMYNVDILRIFSHPDSLLTSQLRASLCAAFRRSLRVTSCTVRSSTPPGRFLSCRSCQFGCRIEWHVNVNHGSTHWF
jgi:hypothetical protein